MKVMLDGREAYAYTGGKPLDTERPGVVFIHGALHDHSVWILQSRYMAHHGRAVLAVDLPGHGRSAGPACLRVEEAADWVTAFVHAAGLHQVTLVGHSMGSLIALEAAARLGSAAQHLVMVGAAYPMQVAPALLKLSREAPLEAIERVNTLSQSTFAAKPSFPGPGFSIHQGNRRLMQRMLGLYDQTRGSAGDNLFAVDFTACDAYAGLDAAAARVQCPTTLVLGRRDQMTPLKAAGSLQAALKAHTVKLDAGHNLMAEAPDGVLAAVLAASSPAPSTPA